MRLTFRTIVPFLIFILTSFLQAQSLPEILMHFSEKEMEVPLRVRQKMLDNKGNTLSNYDNYKLNIYDKRARFLKISTPLEVTYEICVWKINNKKDLLVALCETRCGTSCGSKIRFFLPSENWKEVPAEKYIPTFTLDDIFNAKRLEKNYLTPQNVIKDFQVKTQFLLPQSGHDIMVIFTCLDELEKSEYQRIFKYLDGAMMDLIWGKDGTFSKSEPYFSGN